MNDRLLLHEEVVLLALRDDKGTFAQGMYMYSIAGAMLSELLLQEKIIANEDKQQTIAVIDATATGCEVLDELLRKIDESKDHLGLQKWVTKAAYIKEANHRIASSLCEKGILEKTTDKVLFLFTRRIYPELDGSYEDEIRDRMRAAMFQPEASVDERTGVLIAFAHSGGLLKRNFAPDELSQHHERISEIAKGQHLAAGATDAAIKAAQAAVSAATMAATVAATTAATSS